jgi:hypothetical protein
MADALLPVLEEQRDHLISCYIQQLVNDPQLEALRKISDPEFQGLAGYILTSLSDYVEGEETEVVSCRDFISNTCFQLSIPLLEMTYALYLLRDQVTRVLGADRAGAEVINRVNQFFDRLVLELLRRY